MPGIGQQVNGAYLGVGVGPISFQPAEFGKIAIVIFLAAYLRDTRQVLVQGARRFAGHHVPAAQALRAAARGLGRAMLMLVFIRDLGSSLMFFGGFLALLYVATNRLVVRGRSGWRCSRSARGSSPSTVGHVQDRVEIWLNPFAPDLVDQPAATRSRSRPVRAGRRRAVRHRLRRRRCSSRRRAQIAVPAPHTDLIYAVIVNELGLVGACGLILVYLLFAERGFKIAMLARDSFSKLLAAGLTAVFALQVFVIVGGVTQA